MRKINANDISQTIAELCIEANTNLRPDVYSAIVFSIKQEDNRRAQRILQALLENADCARKHNLAICQDTGLPYVFVRLGQAVLVYAGSLVEAINKGIEKGYKKGYLRNSIVAHPLKREAKIGYSPGVVHIDVVTGRHIDLTVLPKGFGSENKSLLKMFNPTEGIEAIRNFVINAVEKAGADACPPFIVGIGIGAGSDKAALLAKQALLRPVNKRNPDRLLASLEKELLEKINQLNIGPLGLGGKTTALGVSILAAPTHIAGLPVAVNISCHALRSATKRI